MGKALVLAALGTLPHGLPLLTLLTRPGYTCSFTIIVATLCTEVMEQIVATL